MKLDEQWECWTLLCATKNRGMCTYTRGGKGCTVDTYLWQQLFCPEALVEGIKPPTSKLESKSDIEKKKEKIKCIRLLCTWCGGGWPLLHSWRRLCLLLFTRQGHDWDRFHDQTGVSVRKRVHMRKPPTTYSSCLVSLSPHQADDLAPWHYEYTPYVRADFTQQLDWIGHSARWDPIIPHPRRSWTGHY